MLLLPNEKSDKGDKLELSGGQLINLIKTHVKERRGGAYLERERGGGGGGGRLENILFQKGDLILSGN
jgi:hypothetical protein